MLDVNNKNDKTKYKSVKWADILTEKEMQDATKIVKIIQSTKVLPLFERSANEIYNTLDKMDDKNIYRNVIPLNDETVDYDIVTDGKVAHTGITNLVGNQRALNLHISEYSYILLTLRSNKKVLTNTVITKKIQFKRFMETLLFNVN